MVFFCEGQRVAAKVLVSLSFAFLLIALFLSHTRGAWLALVVQVVVFTLLKVQIKLLKWTLICVYLGLLIMIGQWFMSAESQMLGNVPFADLEPLKIRLEIWEIAREQLSERPVIGYGYGFETFPMVNPTIKVSYRPNPYIGMHIHNAILSKAYEVGLVGLVLLMAIFGVIGKLAYNGFQQRPHSLVGTCGLCMLLLLVGVVTRNMFDNMFLGTLSYLFWLLTGLYFSSRLNLHHAEAVATPQRS